MTKEKIHPVTTQRDATNQKKKSKLWELYDQCPELRNIACESCPMSHRNCSFYLETVRPVLTKRRRERIERNWR